MSIPFNKLSCIRNKKHTIDQETIEVYKDSKKHNKLIVCPNCQESFLFRNKAFINAHVKACEKSSLLITEISDGGFICNICSYITSKSNRCEMWIHMKKEHFKEIHMKQSMKEDSFENNIEMEVVKSEEITGGVNYSESSFEASKYIMNQTCLVCDYVFQTTPEVLNHVEDKHLNIILEPKSSENSNLSNVEIKKEFY